MVDLGKLENLIYSDLNATDASRCERAFEAIDLVALRRRLAACCKDESRLAIDARTPDEVRERGYVRENAMKCIGVTACDDEDP